MNRRTFLISGASSGIGKETAKALAKGGFHLVLACRNEEKMEIVIEELKNFAGNPAIEGVRVDFADFDSIRKCSTELMRRLNNIDVLINNAGAFFLKRGETPGGFERTICVNYLSHFLFTHLLLPLLKKGDAPRIVNVGSDSHFYGKLKLEDLHFVRRKYTGFKVYAASRLATMLFTAELAERLADSSVTVNCGHPGHVDTNIWQFDDDATWMQKTAAKIQKRTAITPEEGARCIIYLARSDEVTGISGKYFADCKEKKPAKKSFDPELRKNLWKKSLELTGLSTI